MKIKSSINHTDLVYIEKIDINKLEFMINLIVS